MPNAPDFIPDDQMATLGGGETPDFIPDDAMPSFSDVRSGASSTAPPKVSDNYLDQPVQLLYPTLPWAQIKPRSVVNALPTVGGTVGGIVGGTGGTVGGFGVGGVPGAIGGATLGGSAGESAKKLIEQAAGDANTPPPTAGESAKDIGLAGVEQGAYEGAGIGMSKVLAGPIAKYAAGLRPKVMSAVDKVADEFGLTPQIRGFAKRIVETTVLGRRVVAQEQEKALSRVMDEVAALGEKTTGKAVPPPSAHPDDVIESIDNILKTAKSQDDAAVQAAQDLRMATAQGAHDQAVAEAAAKVASIKAASTQSIADAEKAASKLIESMAAEKPSMISATKAGAEQQMNTELNALAQKMDTDVAARTIRQGAVGRGSEATSGAAIGARQAENLYATATQAAEGVQVPIADFKAQAEAFLEKMRLRPEPERSLENLGTELGVQKAPPQQYKQLAEAQKKGEIQVGKAKSQREGAGAKTEAGEWDWLQGKLGEIQGATMPFEKAREIQQWLAAHLPWEKVSQTQQKGIYKSLWGTLTEKMEGALAEKGALQPFQEANSFWRHYADVFKRGALSNVLGKDPEAVITLVMGKDGGVPSRAKALREAVVGFAERYGTPEEQAAAQSTWQLFQRQFAEKKLLAGGLEGFEKASAKVGDETLNALYGDEVGSRALQNLRDISQAYRDAEKAIGDTIARREGEITGAVKNLKAQGKADIAQAASEEQVVKKTAGEALTAAKKSIKSSPPQIPEERLADQARLDLIRKAVSQSRRAMPGGTGLGGYITPGFLIYGLARHATTSIGIAASVELIGDMTARAMFHPDAARMLTDGLRGLAKGSTTGMLRALDWYIRDKKISLAPPSATPSGPPPAFTPVQGLQGPPSVQP